MRKRGQLAGRIDSRFAGFTTNALAEDMPFDPYTSAVGPAFVSTFNDYYRRDLGVEIDRKYVVSGGLYKEWDRSHVQPGSEYASPAADTGIDRVLPGGPHDVCSSALAGQVQGGPGFIRGWQPVIKNPG